MNELSDQKINLPDTIEDLTQFVLVGKAKLNAYMMKLQTVNRLSTAQEIRDQTLKEAQEVSTALIAAEQRIGELLLALPKSSGKRTDIATSSSDSDKVKPKNEVITEMGYGKNEALDYQKMAKNPIVVQKVIDKALTNGDVVTKASVMREIKAYKERISVLETRKPEVRTEIREVVPDDYREAKSKAKAYDSETKRLNAKLADSYRKQRQLEEEIQDLKEATSEGINNQNLSENVYYFCNVCNNFVGNVGGLVWLTEHISEMPTREKELFFKASQAIRGFVEVFNQNLERSFNNGKRSSETDTGVSALTDREE